VREGFCEGAHPYLGPRHPADEEACLGRNPAAGEAIKIKGSKKIAFRASKDLKEAVM
jgi:DNA-binding protein HU-beta